MFFIPFFFLSFFPFSPFFFFVFLLLSLRRQEAGVPTPRKDEPLRGCCVYSPFPVSLSSCVQDLSTGSTPLATSLPYFLATICAIALSARDSQFESCSDPVRILLAGPARLWWQIVSFAAIPLAGTALPMTTS